MHYWICIINKKKLLSLLITVFAILFISSTQSATADPLDVVEWDSTLVTLNDNLFFDVREALGDIDCTETGGPIYVTITSTRPGVGVIDTITLQAPEIFNAIPGLRFPTTGTCLFGNTELHITPDNNRFPIDRAVTVMQHETNSGEDIDNVITAKDVTITSTADPVGITLTLTETGPNTGTFQNHLLFTSGASVANSAIHVDPGDIVAANYLGIFSYSQILPSPNGSTGILMATIDDIITVTYNGVSADAVVCKCGGPGGSGGGLVRPGFVLDALAGGSSTGDFTPPLLTLSKLQLSSLPLVGDILNMILNADPFTPITPLDDQSIDYPISINGKGFLLTQFANTVQTYTGKTGEPVSFKMTLFDATGVEHIALYTNLRGDQREIQDSDTYIIYNEEKPLEVTDPHGFFANVNFTESENNGKYIANFNLTFAKPMDTSDVIVRTWDEKRNSGDTKIFDAIKIEGEPIVNPTTNDLVKPESSEIFIPYYKLPRYQIPSADLVGNLIYYNSFGGLEQKQVQPYRDPIIYPNSVGRVERHDDGFRDAIIAEEVKAQVVADGLVDDPFVTPESKLNHETFFYPNNVGKLDRKDTDTTDSVKKYENEKAMKISSRHYHTNLIED